VGIDVLGRFRLQRSCHSSRPLQPSFLKVDKRRQWIQGMVIASMGCDLRAGQPMLARRCPTILPATTLTKAMATTRLHRVAGRTGDRTAVVTTRLFRAPHHTISDAGLIGGGLRAEAGRGVAGAPQQPLLGRAARAQTPRAGGAAAAARERRHTATISGHPRSRRYGCTGGAGTDRRAAALARIVRGTARRAPPGSARCRRGRWALSG
jgi:Magnesium chelatase, subunit ChlI